MDEFHPFTSLTGAMLPGRQTQLRDIEIRRRSRSILSGEGMDSLEDPRCIHSRRRWRLRRKSLRLTVAPSFSVIILFRHLRVVLPQSESAPTANSSAGQSECVAEIVATMKRMLGRLRAPASTESIEICARTPTALCANSARLSGAFSLDSMNRILSARPTGKRRFSHVKAWWHAEDLSSGRHCYCMAAAGFRCILPKGRSPRCGPGIAADVGSASSNHDWISMTNAMHSP